MRTKSYIKVTLQTTETAELATVIQKAEEYVKPSSTRWITPNDVTAMALLQIIPLNTTICRDIERLT